MGQGQSATGEEDTTTQWVGGTDEVRTEMATAGEDAQVAGSSPRKAVPPTVPPPPKPPTLARMLPPTIAAVTHPATTMDYFKRMITEAEKQGASSRHDLPLLRFQLDTVRQEAARRKEEHLARIQRELDEERREHSVASAIVLVDPTAPRTKKPKKQKQKQPQQQQQQQQAPLSEVLPTNQFDESIALIGAQHAQIHAANMKMIAQMHQQFGDQQAESHSQPPHTLPLHQLPATPDLPAVSDDCSMEVSSSPVDTAGSFPSYDGDQLPSAESFPPAASTTPPWTPFMISADELHVEPHSTGDPADDFLFTAVQTPTVSTKEERCPSSASVDEIATASSASNTSSDNQQISPASNARLIDRSRVAQAASSTFLDNYKKNSNWLQTLESEYSQGNFSAAGVRQIFMELTWQLEPDDQDEFLDQFAKMNLKGCEEVLATCPHVDVQFIPGRPCCPQRARAHMAQQQQQRDIQKEAHSSITPGDSLVDYPSAQDISPLEAAPDDPDGVSRMRLNLIFESPSTASSIKHKRKKSSSLDDDDAMEEEQLSAPAAGSAVSLSSSSSVISASSGQPHPTRVYRSIQVNKAFEKCTGYTQASIHRAIAQPTDSNSIFSFHPLRADHLRATHTIFTLWRLNHVTEGHIYQVRHLPDGSEGYYILHKLLHIEHGIIVGVENAIIPLPVDDAHPLPPYVEGVDLDVDTLLYGYKPPKTAVQTSVEVCQE